MSHYFILNTFCLQFAVLNLRYFIIIYSSISVIFRMAVLLAFLLCRNYTQNFLYGFFTDNFSSILTDFIKRRLINSTISFYVTYRFVSIYSPLLMEIKCFFVTIFLTFLFTKLSIIYVYESLFRFQIPLQIPFVYGLLS